MAALRSACLAAATWAAWAQPAERPAGPDLRPLLGIPYVDDAVTDGRGRCVTFRAPDVPLPRPGLNCSGFVVAAARRLWGYAGGPREAARDRAGDSGPGAALGEDWDFGYDLALNLTEGRSRRWLTPAGELPAATPALALQAWPVRGPEGWRRAFEGLGRNGAGVAAFLRVRGGRLRFHHVGLLVRERGRAWFYQTLPHGRVHRLEPLADAGQVRLASMFGPGERMVVLAVR
ncbi:MAG: hypothetical protein U0P81_01935 [Holophagaceae bacterium]